MGINKGTKSPERMTNQELVDVMCHYYDGLGANDEAIKRILSIDQLQARVRELEGLVSLMKAGLNQKPSDGKMAIMVDSIQALKGGE